MGEPQAPELPVRVENLEKALRTVARRLVEVEKQNRRLRIGALVGGPVGGALVLVAFILSLVAVSREGGTTASPRPLVQAPAQYPPVAAPQAPAPAPAALTMKTVTAESFVVVDSAGKPRAGLFMGESGVALRLADSAGKVRLGLEVDDKGGTHVLMSDGAGKLRLRLDVDDKGEPCVTMSGGAGKASVSLSGGNSPALDLYGPTGKSSATLAVLEDGPGFILRGTDGKTRAMLTTGKDGAALGLYGENEKARAFLDTSKDGAALNLADEKGTGRACLGAGTTVMPDGTKTTHPESSLWLFGPDGKGVWKAP